MTCFIWGVATGALLTAAVIAAFVWWACKGMERSINEDIERHDIT